MPLFVLDVKIDVINFYYVYLNAFLYSVYTVSILNFCNTFYSEIMILVQKFKMIA